MEEIDLNKKVKIRFNQALKKQRLSITEDAKWNTSLSHKRFDLLISKNGYPFVIIEIKNNLKNTVQSQIAQEYIRSALAITNAEIGIITDNQQFYYCEKDTNFSKCSFNKIIARITSYKLNNISSHEKEKIINIFNESAHRYLPDNQDILRLVNEIQSNYIKFDNSSRTFSFIDNKDRSFENQLFSSLLGKFNIKKVCRYTSFHSTFNMIQNLSFPMSGLAGMNDKSEVDYVERYLDTNINSLPITKRKKDYFINSNNKYITSCSKYDKQDNLTFWRLYGDEAKGTCLIFDVDPTKLNNNILLNKVSYADKKGQHNELNFLKYIQERTVEETSYPFKFNKLNYWKHFFKPYDYQDEEEIRLIVINDENYKIKTEWVLTHSHSIINPMIFLDIKDNNFPLILQKIILGPKCPEKELNCIQLKEMIRKIGNSITHLEKLNVECSKIENYR